MWQLWAKLLLLIPSVGAFVIQSRSATKFRRSGHFLRLGTDYPDLEKCLYREYSSFFSPMEKSFYSGNVKFIDPMTSFEGIEKYQNNVDMLAGRTGLGKIMFKDASIVLHNIEQLDKQKIQTRWTLQVTVKILPWQPRARFTGVSVYSIDNNGKVIQQDDYWDSVNLVGGKYVSKSTSEGIKDFLAQLRQEAGAEMAAPELPYELLRRAGRYEVRRYPATLVAETTYDQRPEGYDRLGSYAGGSNENGVKIPYYSPTLMRISDTDGKRRKLMSWPVAFAYPGQPLPAVSTLPEPTIPKVTVNEKPGVVVAVTRFELAATEPIVRGFTGQLLSDVKADKMTPSAAAESGDCLVGQFDALFSLNKRRNEVWVELVDHPWK
jgi:SOUL heme-binding protein/Uncharacterized conserved protein (DUF2358)